MATTITEIAQDRTQFIAVFTATANSDISSSLGVHIGYALGYASSTRSGASAYTVLLQSSVDGLNWYTLATLTEAATTANLTAQLVVGTRFIRLNATTTNSQTITVTVKFAR